MNWIVPMEPILLPHVMEKENFIHQVKWDGIRGLCYIQNGKVQVFTKKGRERTLYYPELMELPSLLKKRDAVLDGEIIVLNEEMRPSFQLVLMRERVNDKKKVNYYSRKYPVKYIVFDLLSLNNELITHLSLKERKHLLQENLTKSSNITITDDFENGAELFSLMKQKGWEGIVSKDIDSPYIPGKNHQAWFKTKLSRKILAIVAGLTMIEGNPNSLILAIQGSKGLLYIGRASVGLSQQHLMLLKEAIPELKAEKNPFDNFSGNAEDIPSRMPKELKDAVWLKATVSMPVTWNEVKSGIKPEDFTLNNAMDRLKKVGDLFEPLLSVKTPEKSLDDVFRKVLAE